MRYVLWTDRRGYNHRSLVRDDDPDEAAPHGILCDPPVVEMLDWEQVKKDLHNALLASELYTWMDVQVGQGLRGAILTALRKKLIGIYRQVEREATYGHREDGI